MSNNKNVTCANTTNTVNTLLVGYEDNYNCISGFCAARHKRDRITWKVNIEQVNRMNIWVNTQPFKSLGIYQINAFLLLFHKLIMNKNIFINELYKWTCFPRDHEFLVLFVSIYITMRCAAATLNATCYSLCTKHYQSPTLKINDTKWKQNEREWITDRWHVCISMIQSLGKRAEHRVLYYGKTWHWEKSYLAHKSFFIQKQMKERLQILIIYTNATPFKNKRQNTFKSKLFLCSESTNIDITTSPNPWGKTSTLTPTVRVQVS